MKIDLMLRGIRGIIDESGDIKPLKGLLSRAGEGIDIILPLGMPANVPSGEEFTKNSPYWLKKIGKKDTAYAVTDGETDVEVRLVPPPAFYNKKTSTGIEMSRIAKAHGSYVVITPSPKCDFFREGVECKYCAGNFDVSDESSSTLFTVDEVLETVEAVLKETATKVIYISIGFSDGDDGGIKLLAPYIEAVKKHFNCLVAVEALPPKDNSWIDKTYALGADSVLYNLEIFDPELFKIICPGRAELIGRERYIESLKHAASIFPNGTVASHLIVGLEPPGATQQGVDFLTSIGVVPILPIYRPQQGKALRMEPLTTEIILPVYRKLYEAVKRNNINMNWVRDISSVTTPIESRLLSGGKDGEKGSFLESFYKTRLGHKTAWGLSTIRRKLRVKSDDPMDPSDK